MQLATFEYLNGQWSCDQFPALDSINTWVLVFADPTLADLQQRTEELARAYPNSKIIGCTTSGEIFDHEVKDQSLAVAVTRFEQSRIEQFTLEIPDASQSHEVAAQLCQQLDSQNLKALFVLADGLNLNGTQFVAAIQQTLPNLPLTGGLAGDGTRFEKTQTLAQNQWRSHQVVALAFYGDAIQIGLGSKGGWVKFGPERLITKSDENTLYELDGQPALALYKQYLGDKANDLPNSALFFPIGLVQKEGDPIVRTVLGVNEEDQSVYFAGDMPEGEKCQLMRANFEEVIDGAYDAAKMIDWQKLPGTQPTLLIAISCVGRRVVLKELIEEEVAATLEHMPRNTQQIGYYSFGEISPLTNGVCGFHNQTMTLTSFRENDSL